MSGEPINLDDFRVAEEELQTPEVNGAAGRVVGRSGEPFLGRTPWAWLVAAGKLPGQALQVAMILRFRAGLNRTKVVRFNQASGGEEMGVSVWAARRAIRLLEGAGLVSVRRLPGKVFEVTLRDVLSRAKE